jgi:hypothetical protein
MMVCSVTPHLQRTDYANDFVYIEAVVWQILYIHYYTDMAE